MYYKGTFHWGKNVVSSQPNKETNNILGGSSSCEWDAMQNQVGGPAAFLWVALFLSLQISPYPLPELKLSPPRVGDVFIMRLL